MSSGESSEVSIHRRHGSPSCTRRQLEIERLPVRVHDQVQARPSRRISAPNARLCECGAPVGLQSASRRARPLLACRSMLGQADALLLVRLVAQQPPRDQQAHEAMDVGMLLQQRPVEPVGLVVVAVGVVVAALRAAHLVAHQDHRHAEREQRHGEEVLHLAVAQPLDRGIVGRPLDAAVPAAIVVGAVAVVLAVGLVVLRVVGDEIVQREAVVAGDEVDAGFGLAPLVAVDLGAAQQPVGQPRATVPSSPRKKLAHVVAEPAVPLLPGVADEAADLIEAGGVPRLGDELRAGERRIRFDVPQDRRVGHRMARRIARQDRREVEAEAVHVHLLDPVAQAVDDHAADDRMVGVERVAAAGVVGIPRPVALEDVVGRVVEPAEARASGRVDRLRPCG